MRVPKTIWLYTFFELWRVILLSVVILVVVIAFASTVRHTAEGKLGPLETLRFMLYAMPPMLQYALPFAAGFGATLAFHRMTQDNEVTAASASGVSHHAILGPAMVTGVIIACTLSYLSGQIIPRFLRSMEQMITLDATKILMNSIRAGRPVEFAGKVVHARSVYQISPPPEGAIDQLVLTDLSALELDANGWPTREIFARRAWLSFYRSEAEQPDDLEDRSRSRTVTLVAMKFEGSQTYQPGKGAVASEQGGLVHAIAGGVRDEPKFLTTTELAELPSHPDRYGDINQFRRGLALTVVERQWFGTIDRSLRRDGKVKFVDADNREYTITASSLEQRAGVWTLRPPAPGREVEVERTSLRGKEPATRFTARTATLERERSEHEVVPVVKLALRMKNVQGQSQGGTQEAAGVNSELSYAGLQLAGQGQYAALGLPSLKLLELIRETGLIEDPEIGPRAEDLRVRIVNLGKHVRSKQHERAASVVASLIMVITGAVTALRLGASMPLTVYLWSFFPAVLTMVLIGAGQHSGRAFGAPGLSVMWLGVVGLAAYTAAAYALVRRH